MRQQQLWTQRRLGYSTGSVGGVTHERHSCKEFYAALMNARAQAHSLVFAFVYRALPAAPRDLTARL
jgi:hypothetical protein